MEKTHEKSWLNIFKYREMSIRAKLLTIISVIVIVSLTIITYNAVATFSNDAITRIRENNKQTTKFLAGEIETDLKTKIQELELIYSMQNTANKDIVLSKFFGENRDSLYVGIHSVFFKNSQEVVTKTTQELYNPIILKNNNLASKMIQGSVLSFQSELVKVFQGQVIVKNISPIFGSPLLLILIPIIEKNNTINNIASMVLKVETLVESFKPTGISRSYLVDLQGNVILHHNDKLIISAENLSKNITFQEILKKSKTSISDIFQFLNERSEVQLGAFRKIETGNLMVVSEIPESKALEAAEQVKINSLLITIIILLIAISFIYIFAKTISDPIKLLVDASNKIKSGNYQIDLESKMHDEIGHLTAAFNVMAQGLDEREKLKGAFGKFVNPEIAERALRGELQLGGERKDATVFFSDIRSFTAISEKLEPEEVVEFLNEYMTLMVNCINQTNGVVDKFIGDAIMAVWGTPVSKGNDAEHCINAALLMRKSLIEFNRSRGGEKKPKIMIGCGINSGAVLSGQIGSNERLEYTVIGDTVNLASRVETLNKPFRTDILISEETYNRVKELFYCHPMQKIKVKGKEDAQQIYAVLGSRSDPTAPKTIGEMRELVGIPRLPDDSDVAQNQEFKDEGEVKYEILQERRKTPRDMSLVSQSESSNEIKLPMHNRSKWIALISQCTQIKDYSTGARLALLYCDYFPQDTNLMLMGSRLCCKAKLFPEAISIGERLQERDPNNIANLLNLCFAYSKIGDRDRGKVYAEQILAIDPNHLEARQIRDKLGAFEA